MSARLTPREGWLSLLLLLLLQLSVAWSLQGANWAPGLEILNRVVLMALVIGVLLAKTRLPGILAHLFSAMVGIGWITWLGLGLVSEVGGWVDQFVELAIRIIRWFQAAMADGVSADNLIFVLQTACLFWAINYASAWSLCRTGNIWGVLIPASVTILVNTYYAQQGLSFFLIAFFICAFLLIVRTFLFEQEREWQANGVTYSPDLGFDFLRDGAIFAVTVIILAWLVPAAVERGQFNPILARMGAPLGAAQQNWNRLFAALNYRGTSGGSWFGRSMTFQGPLRLTDEVVMDVQAEGGRYWRAAVFDRYNSAGWTATNGRVVDLESTQVPGVGPSSVEKRKPVRQVFTIYNPAGTLLFAASQPLQISLPASMLVAGPAAELTDATATALAQLYAERPLYRGQVYEVTSAVSEADEASLRAAGTAYPEYIREAYMQLPETITPRVQALAQELTASAETPYDKAKAIEQYLRTIPYNENIPGPQPGQDGVDYFLFEQKSGYCDYYASSMAVMLRGIGIPARIAQGYSQGEPNLESSSFQVRQRDAHTWVEVYFPSYGWIEFEPTAAEPQNERRPTSESEETDTSETPAEPTRTAAEEEAERLRRLEEDLALRDAQQATPGLFRNTPTFNLRMLALPLGLLLAAGMLTYAGRWALGRRWRGLSLIERIFDQLAVAARLVGVRQDPAQTPDEYATRVATQVPPAQSALRRLATLFGRARFSRDGLSEQEEQEANDLWRDARATLIRASARAWRRIRRS